LGFGIGGIWHWHFGMSKFRIVGLAARMPAKTHRTCEHRACEQCLSKLRIMPVQVPNPFPGYRRMVASLSMMLLILSSLIERSWYG
jgi:hypothetical protein